MKPLLLSGLLLTAICLPVSSVSAASVRMMGAGNVSCKEWGQLRTSTEYFSAGNWVLGFLSSTAWSTGEDVLSGKTAEKLFKAIDQLRDADLEDSWIKNHTERFFDDLSKPDIFNSIVDVLLKLEGLNPFGSIKAVSTSRNA